jgi:predicted SprT family Zn-dependent metalloprotease
MISQTTIRKEFEKVVHELGTTFPEYRDSFQKLAITCSSKRRIFGSYNIKGHKVKVNPQFFAEGDMDKLNDTIRHEIAHAIQRDHYRDYGKSHGLLWKRLARKFGADPKASHAVSPEAKKQIKSKYTLMFGSEIITKYSRKPKHDFSHPEVGVTGRPETKGKLKLVQNW